MQRIISHTESSDKSIEHAQAAEQATNTVKLEITNEAAFACQFRGASDVDCSLG